jgi:hypothetical protein
VCARLTEARLQQQSIRGNVALSLIQQIILELRLFFPVGISEQSMSYSSMFKSLEIGLMGFLLCAATAWAGPASIQGIVKDAKGQPIKAADVRIESVDGKQLFKTVKTDARGRYVSQGLQLRVYRVTLLVNGVVKACITNIKTKQDQATELNFDLKRLAAAQGTTERKKGNHVVWVPARTGSHLGGNWVEVDEYGKAASDSAIHTATGDDLRRQQLTQQPGSLPGQGPTPPP